MQHELNDRGFKIGDELYLREWNPAPDGDYTGRAVLGRINYIVIHPRCINTIDEFTLYSWKVDPHTSAPIPELEDKHNHLIDAVRYATENRRRSPILVMPIIESRPHDFPGGGFFPRPT